MAGETSSGAADRSNNTETGRIDDPWRKIETEKPQRDAARRAWDAEHDPSPEFEYAIRPLGDDYGKDRPASRELTDEQRAELEEVFGRPADELLALRDKDPRAGHNRDDQGRILDHDGQPRPERTPEEILREAQRQVDRYGSTATQNKQEIPEDAPDRQALSETPDESNHSQATETSTTDAGNGIAGDDGRGEVEQGIPDEPEPTSNRREDLSELLGTLVHDLRDGDLSNDQAAEHVEAFHESIRPEQIEVVPPDGKRLVVDIDEQGRPDLSNPRVEDGASQIDQLQSTRRIAHGHGDQAAEPPEPAGDELSGDSERRDLDEKKPPAQQLWANLTKRADDVYDAGKHANQIVNGAIKEPPAGTAETRTPPRFEATIYELRPDDTSGVQDPVGSLATIGLMLGAMYARFRRNSRQEGQAE